MPSNTQARLMPHVYRSHIAQLDGGAVGRAQHRAANVVHGVDQTDPAHHCGLRSEIYGLTTHIDVAVVEHLNDLRDGKAVGHELVQVNGHLVCFGLASPAVDVDHPRHCFEAALEHPILDGLEIHHRVARRPDHAITIDLADRAPRRDLRNDTVWQRR